MGTYSNFNRRKTLLPVMVWINGGDFILCSGSELSYNGNQMSKQGNVVIVTFNNRLGILVFMVSDLLAKQDSLWTNLGNYGFLDQNLAFHCVRDNFKAFGGDPHQVTIFGVRELKCMLSYDYAKKF